jgi:hypothetical protein
MKVIDLSGASPTLAEVLELAREDNVIPRTKEGRQYLLAEIDDSAEEVARAGQNAELMRLLDERSRETTRFSFSEVRERIHGKKRSQRKSQKK